MKSLTLLSLASIAGLAAAEFIVIDKPVHARKAADVCESKGYRLAKLKGGKHSNIKKATKALYKAKVGEAWIASLDKKKHNKALYLAKPVNFRNDRKAGDVFRAKCDGDKVCNDVRAVLCDDGESDKKKKKSKKHSKKSKKHSRRNRYYSSESDEGCNPEEEYGCEEEEVEEEPYYEPKKPQKYY